MFIYWMLGNHDQNLSRYFCQGKINSILMKKDK